MLEFQWKKDFDYGMIFKRAFLESWQVEKMLNIHLIYFIHMMEKNDGS